MKILLDENIPAKLKLDFGVGYEIKTVRDMNWQGTKNGKLLALIAEFGFDFFITLDRNLRHQQNLSNQNFSIMLLIAPNNKHQTLQPMVRKIHEILMATEQAGFIEVEL